MAVKETIVMELSPEGCAKAIKKLETYRKNLPRRNFALCKNLAELARVTAKDALDREFRAEIGDYYETSDPDTVTFKTSRGKGLSSLTANCSMVGTGADLLFIEFGAGVKFNGNPHGSPHPKGKELGYTIGDYSDKHLGLEEEWAWFDGERWHHSRGTYAVMPMMKAADKIKDDKSAVLKAAEDAWNGAKSTGGSP